MFIPVWKQDMSCALEKILMVEASGHTSKRVNLVNVFHDVNLILYTVHSMGQGFAKSSRCFR